MVSFLIKSLGVSPNQQDSRGYPPLYYAIKAGCLRMVHHLINCGSAIRQTHKGGFSPIRESIRLHHHHEPSITYALLQAGADINEQNRQGQNVLFSVCSGGLYHPAFVNELIHRWGADPKLVDEKGNGILHKIVDISVLNSFFAPTLMEVIQFLVTRAGLDPNGLNSEGETPLYIVCRKCVNCPAVLSIASSLIKVGANPNFAVGSYGWTPLWHAAFRWNSKWIDKSASQKLINFLLEHGADPSIPNNRRSGNTLIHAMANADRGDLALLKLLVEKSSNPHQTNDSGWTALHMACYFDYPQATIRALVEGGMDPSCLDGTGQTVLHRLLQRQNVNMDQIKFLIEMGCDVNTKRTADNDTALHVAVRQGHSREVFQLLIQFGTDLESPNDFALPPLHLAASSSSVDVIRNLKEAGASLYTAEDDNIFTPLAVACVYTRGSDVLQEVIPSDFDGERTTDIHKLIKAGNVECVRHFFRVMGNTFMNTKFYEGLTPLHVAASVSKEMCEVFINFGINVNATEPKGFRPLHFSTSDQIVDTLVRAGAIVHATTKSGLSALAFAARHSRDQTVSALLRHGARDNIALAYTCISVSTIETFNLLLEAHSDLNIASFTFFISNKKYVECSNMTLLHFLCRTKQSVDDFNPRLPIAKKILENLSTIHGAGICARDTSGSNALEYACSSCQFFNEDVQSDDLGMIYELLKFQVGLSGDLQGAMAIHPSRPNSGQNQQSDPSAANM